MGDSVRMGLSGNYAEGLAKLAGDALTGIIRGGGNAMSEVFQMDAIIRAPEYKGPPRTGKYRITPGQLKRAIYRAYSESKSTPTQAVYDVSWNPRKAPHAHLIENGHWLVRGGTLKKGGRKVKWVAAKPFLRPAYEARKQAAADAALARMRVKFAEVIK